MIQRVTKSITSPEETEEWWIGEKFERSVRLAVIDHYQHPDLPREWVLEVDQDASLSDEDLLELVSIIEEALQRPSIPSSEQVQ